MRTPDISKLLIPIEDTIRNRFIPAITGGRICNAEERRLLTLPTRYGELAILRSNTTTHEEQQRN